MTEKEKSTQSTASNRRRALLIGGVASILFSLYLLAFLVPDVLATAGGPQTMTLAQAGEIATDTSTYALIEDPIWECDTISYVRGPSSSTYGDTTRFTDVMVVDAESSAEIIMLTHMSGEQSCLDLREATLSGYLTRMDADMEADFRNTRYSEATTFLEFCGYCGQENSMIGVIFGVLFLIGGIVLVIIGLRISPEQVDASGTR